MSRFRVALLLVFGAVALADVARAAAAPCKAELGDIVDFGVCNPVSLPGLEVRFLGVSQPDERVRLLCWRYEASTGTGDVEEFKQCHTGVPGGHSTLSLGGRTFTVLFDVSSGCAQMPSGSWAPKTRGHAFHAGVMDSAAREAFWRKQSEDKERCVARGGPK
ncbi:MAG: hypothetical protein ACSLFQ_10235 [Thermoanaerobaculia bacterium]